MNFGLLKHTPSRKDYSHRKTFGTFPADQLPAEYLLPSTVLDQGTSSACTAYSACAVAETKYGTPFDPNQLYSDEAIVNGFPSNGYPMRTVMDTVRKIGLTRMSDRGTVKEDQYFSLNGWGSLSKSIMTSMWLAKDEKRCAELGMMWYDEFTGTPVVQPNRYKRLPHQLQKPQF